MPKVPKIKSLQYQYIKENVNDEVEFSPADKHQRFLQIYSLFLDGYGQAFPKYPNNKFGISLQCLKKNSPRKKWVIKLVFCMQINMKVSYKLILQYLMETVKHPQSSQDSKFPMSLQYLRKEVRDEVDFLHAGKHQNFLQVDFNTFSIKVSYKVILPFLMGTIKHPQSTQINKSAISLHYLKKRS